MRCRIFLVESVVLIVLMEALNGLSFLMERHRRRLRLSTARMFPRFMISSWRRGLQQRRSRKAHFPNSVPRRQVRDLRGGRRDKEAGAGRDSAIPEDFGGDVQNRSTSLPCRPLG